MQYHGPTQASSSNSPLSRISSFSRHNHLRKTCQNNLLYYVKILLEQALFQYYEVLRAILVLVTHRAVTFDELSLGFLKVVLQVNLKLNGQINIQRNKRRNLLDRT